MFSHSMSPTKSPTHGGGWVKLTNSESPDVATKLSVIIPQELLGSNLEFGYAVGSGGGHRLIIKEATVVVTKSPMSTFSLPNVDSTVNSDVP